MALRTLPTSLLVSSPCSPQQEWEYLLEELALWFLMYSEGANLRHVPEALWFLYWCLRNSHEKQMQITVPPPTDARSAAFIGACRLWHEGKGSAGGSQAQR
jgi:hypothetical protein